MLTGANIQCRLMRIGGREVAADDVIEVRYPYTNEVIGTVPAGHAEHVREAFEVAANYRPRLSRYERQQILLKAADLVWSRRAAISDTITLELGISKKDSLYECGRARDVFTLAGQMCLIDDGQSYACDVTHHGQARRIFTKREPLRAISAITPFNHPLNMVAHKIAQMLSVVTGLPEDIGDEMVTNRNAELITFTGGVRVGKMIAEKAGYRRAILELGGNDPLIVMDDLAEADIERAAALAVAGATRNSGQRCTAVKRILVDDGVADAFVARVLTHAKSIRYGDPMHPDTDLGTVIDAPAAELFEKRVAQAAKEGARVLYDPGRKGALFPPVVIDHVDPRSELVLEETFGPVIPIIRCRGIDDMIATSNGTAFGLSSGVCTNRLDHATRFIEELRVGTVNIWEVPGYRTEMSPFGGVKDSGNGTKEGVVEAMRAYTNLKTFSLPWPA
jgi:phosphonoacetaldehyde dehydrogenase